MFMYSTEYQLCSLSQHWPPLAQALCATARCRRPDSLDTRPLPLASRPKLPWPARRSWKPAHGLKLHRRSIYPADAAAGRLFLCCFPPTSPGETASFALAALLSIVCLFALHCLSSVYPVLHLACGRRGKELNWQPRLCVSIVPRSAVHRQTPTLSLFLIHRLLPFSIILLVGIL